MRISRGLAIGTIALLATCGVAGGIALYSTASDIPKALRGIVLSEPVPVETVTLQRQSGDLTFPAGVADGRWTILAIGFTHCPDVCPFMLNNLAKVEEAMAAKLPQDDLPQVVFMSVDPDRDSAEMLNEYVHYFSDRFVGVTGSRAAIDRVTGQIGAFYRLGKKDKDGDYTVDHSAEIYLFDPAGMLFAKFKSPLDPEKLTAQFRDILQFHQGRQT